MLRLQPDLLINERNGKPWHVQISEQAIKPAAPGVAWEACMTLNDNWAYHAGDTGWQDPCQVIQMLTETASTAAECWAQSRWHHPRGIGLDPERNASRAAAKWRMHSPRTLLR